MIDEVVLDQITTTFVTQARVNAFNIANGTTLTLTQARIFVKAVLTFPNLLTTIKARLDLERGMRNIQRNLADFQAEYGAAVSILQLQDEADAIAAAINALSEEF